jgi:KTSC domain-containing protein
MPSPEMQPVNSSNVAAIGYDSADEVVYVQFLNGSRYAYKGVPEHEFERLKMAASVGSYLNRNFKNVYPYERVQG